MSNFDSNVRPTHAERFRFDNEGYLLIEDFLEPEHVARLDHALDRTVARRRELAGAGILESGRTVVDGDSTRIFHILDDDPMFLELLDWPRTMAYVRALLNAKPHHHASDAIVETRLDRRGMGWHLDGHDEGYRGLGWPIPLLQLKVGYFLSDMTRGGQGNLCVVPGSHRSRLAPDPGDLANPALFDGALELKVPSGSAVFFHNALWHSGGPWSDPDGERRLLYYAYEHPWMMASMEHWSYPKDFYARLDAGRRSLFHGFLFDPPERRWG